MRRAALVLLLSLAAGPPARAGTRIDGTVFPDTVQAGGATLALNGVGTRVVFAFIDAYATGLYLRAPARTEAAVLAGADPKAMLTVFLHGATLAQMRTETERVHRRFCATNPCPARDQASYATFLASLTPAHAGERQLIVVSDAGVAISRDDRPPLDIPDPGFGANLLRSLLGPTAPTAGYARGLLGARG